MMFIKDALIPNSMSGNLNIEGHSQKLFSGASDNESFIEVIDTPLTVEAFLHVYFSNHFYFKLLYQTFYKSKY